MSGKDVYGIIEPAHPFRFGPIGVGPQPSEVSTVHSLQTRLDGYVADIVDELRQVSVASRINTPIDDMIVHERRFLGFAEPGTGVQYPD